MHDCIHRDRRLTMFQSAPDREVGRCSRFQCGRFCGIRFNPRPTVRSGDATCSPLDKLKAKCFNPRPTVRSGDAGRAHNQTHPSCCFNPRPTVRSGDAYAPLPIAWVYPVSIRARP